MALEEAAPHLPAISESPNVDVFREIWNWNISRILELEHFLNEKKYLAGNAYLVSEEHDTRGGVLFVLVSFCLA